MLTTFINALMSAEADAVGGAEYGARSKTRKNSRIARRTRYTTSMDLVQKQECWAEDAMILMRLKCVNARRASDHGTPNGIFPLGTRTGEESVSRPG